MSVENGYIRHKKHVKQENGTYKPISYWTSSNSVEMDSGNTLQEEMDLIDIQTTTDATLYGSKSGGLRVNHMVGNTEQRTYNGYQLFDASKLATKSAGGATVTNNGDGSFTVSGNGTLTEDFAISHHYTHEEAVELLKAGTMKLKNNGTVFPRPFIQLVDASGVLITLHDGKEFEIKQDYLNDTSFTMYLYFNGYTGDNIISGTVKPMLYQDGDGTWEPFCGAQPSPNPEYQQSIHNTGDCVEMIQGDHDLKTGNYRYNNNYVTCKYHIPCKENDLINIKTEDLKIIYVVYYSDDGFIKIESSITSTTNATFTVPNGCTHFAIDIGLDYTPYPLDTVGKIQLTINGKYVVQIVENWKNCLMITAKSSTTSGVDFSVDKDKGTIACKGTSTGINFEVAKIDCKKYYGKKICLSGCPNVGSSITYWCEYVITYNDGTPNRWGIRDYGNSNVITIDENMAEIVYFIVFNNGYTANNLMFKPQLEIGDKFTGFEPYTEKVATIFLDEPLREGDRLVKVDGVFNHNHKCGVVDLGTLNWAQDKDCSSMYCVKCPEAKHGMNMKGNGCYCTHYTDAKKKNIASWTEFYETNNIISCGSVYINHEQKNSAIVVTDNRYTDVTEFKNAMNGVILEYELAEETFTPLDTASQIALNSLKTFDTVTHITVDSVTQPAELEVEFGKSKVGAYTLKSLNDNDIDRIERAEMKAQLNELATALVAVGSEV